MVSCQFQGVTNLLLYVDKSMSALYLADTDETHIDYKSTTESVKLAGTSLLNDPFAVFKMRGFAVCYDVCA